MARRATIHDSSVGVSDRERRGEQRGDTRQRADAPSTTGVRRDTSTAAGRVSRLAMLRRRREALRRSLSTTAPSVLSPAGALRDCGSGPVDRSQRDGATLAAGTMAVPDSATLQGGPPQGGPPEVVTRFPSSMAPNRIGGEERRFDTARQVTSPPSMSVDRAAAVTSPVLQNTGVETGVVQVAEERVTTRRLFVFQGSSSSSSGGEEEVEEEEEDGSADVSNVDHTPVVAVATSECDNSEAAENRRSSRKLALDIADAWQRASSRMLQNRYRRRRVLCFDACPPTQSHVFLLSIFRTSKLEQRKAYQALEQAAASRRCGWCFFILWGMVLD